MSGVGRTYLRGKTWWIAWYRFGRQVRESSHSTSQGVARKLLQERIAKGRVAHEDRISFDDLTALVITDYEVKGRRSLYDLRTVRIPHLRRVFGGERASEITAARVRTYIAERKREGAANSSINRELGILKRGFKLAMQDGLITLAPHIAKLPETNIRRGFVTSEQFGAIAAKLPEDARDTARWLYLTGWRLNEALTLEWRDVDAEARQVILRGERSKTGQGRALPLGDELGEIIDRARTLRRLETPYVFHLNGKMRLRWSFSRVWRKAAQRAGLGGIMVHDLRRSAARNMVRAGVPERVAMAMTGHRTRSMFDRYNIVSGDDLIAAQARVRDYLDGQPKESKVLKLERR